MRVTHAMLARAWRALETRGLPEGNLGANDLQSALEAALADVPEPQLGEVRFTVPERLWDERIAALEAKLAKVRAALVEHSPSKALVILDGEDVT